jgi:serine/threonine-protein kinase
MISRDPQINLKITCHSCQQKLDASEIPAFSYVDCPSCGGTLIVPRRFGQYLLEEPLGETEVAGVYRALDLKLDREVAVKVLDKKLTGDAEAVELFVSLGRRVAALNHPNIVPIYSSDEFEEMPFLVMEYMAEHSVETLLMTDHELPVSRCLRVVEEAARGLASAYREGLVHLNLKPTNLLLADGDLVKVTDFGLDALLGDKEDADERRVDPRYISPEGIAGSDQDCRSDIFSLGAILFHLLTGEPPFGHDISRRLTGRGHKGAIDPKSLRPEISRELSQFIMSMLDPDPARRPQNYKTIIHSLAVLRHKLPDLGSRKTKKKRRSARSGDAGSNKKKMRKSKGLAKKIAAKHKQQRKRRMIVDLILLLLLILFAGFLVLSARRRAPWYVNHVEPFFERLTGQKTDEAEPVDKALPARDEPTTTAGDTEPPVLTPPEDASVEDDKPSAPAVMASRPRPPDLNFAAVEQELREYLRQQPDDMRELERERIYLLNTVRPHLFNVMQRVPYRGTPIKLKNGSSIAGTIPLCNEKSLTVKRARGGRVFVQWSDLAFEQYLAFFDFYISHRLNFSDTGLQQHQQGDPHKDAAKDAFLAALLADWYGRPAAARRFKQMAEKFNGEIAADTNRFLYYLETE